MVIYCTTNLINGKKYIGQDSKNNPMYLGSGNLISKAIKKYGKENFKKEILQECIDRDDLNESEIYWIDYFNAAKSDLFYNISTGGLIGDGLTYHPNKANIIKKIAVASNNFWSNPDERKKVSIRIKKMYEDCPEKRIKRSEDAKAMWLSDEYRNKYFAIRKELFNKKKISEEYNSPEAKARRSKIAKKALADPEVRERQKQKLKKTKNLPENKLKMAEENRKRWSDPEFKKRVSDKIRETRNTPESKRKASEARTKYWKNKKSQNNGE